MRVIAVDWSGAHAPASQRRGIQVAEAIDGELRALSGGRTREETFHHLLDELERRPETVVALDLSFSFPAWWVHAVGAVDAPELWQVAAEHGEEWLAGCRPPFWGRRGRPCPPARAHQARWRRTELATHWTDGRASAAVPSAVVPSAATASAGAPDAGAPDAGAAGADPGAADGKAWTGRLPKSTFQIGGAGSVGTGSIRGMPYLARMRSAGVAVWPFDPWPRTGGPVAAEVYPRWCTGQVVKARAGARTAHMATAWPRVRGRLLDAATESEDAFDAACTALTISAHVGPCAPPASLGLRDPLDPLAPHRAGDGPDELDRVEGRILSPGAWCPRDVVPR